ncbi:MAG: MbnP family copper-binding protein [Cyanobacteria bacterium J06621_8]
MYLTSRLKSIAIATAIVLSGSVVKAQSELEEVAINFEAFVGEKQFECGTSYEEVGTGDSTITPTDFRFYVSNVALIDSEGNVVPVELEQDGKWQYQNVALLDFENGTESCDNGNSETRTQVVGTVPQGEYKSLQFTMGIPAELNHDDAAIAPSPLNLTSMWWNWQGGYKFLRLELETSEAIATVSSNFSSISQTSYSKPGESTTLINQQTVSSHGNSSTTQTSTQTSVVHNGHGTHHQASSTHSHGDHGGHGGHGGHQKHGNNNAYIIHLGSTGCSESTQSNLFSCANPNRVEVKLENFDVEKNVVGADIGQLLADSNLGTNQENTPNGCMSSPKDGDCLPILENLNLSSSPDGEQNLFFMK